MSETLFRIAPVLDIRAGKGSVRLNDVRARVDQSPPPVARLVLVAELSAEDAARLQDNHWMHLSPEHCTARAGGVWRADEPVQLEARPGTDLLTAATLLAEDVWDVLAEIRFARTLAALHDESSWFALTLTQPDPHVPGVRMGVATTWADAGRV